MARHPNFAKLAKAHILEWAAHHTLESFGYQGLHEIFAGKLNIQDGERKSYYLELGAEDRAANSHGEMVAYLVAKYLLLNGGQRTYCASMTELNYEIEARHLPRDVEPNERIAEIMGGNGYLVVPQFVAQTPTPTDGLFDKAALREIGDKLASHVYDGGGLVLVGSPITHPSLQHFGQLAAQIENSFQIVKLNAKGIK